MSDKPACGCLKPESPPKYTGRPRVLRAIAEERYEAIAEPMMAIAEGNDVLVLGCGDRPCPPPTTATLRVERLKRQPAGDFVLDEEHSADIPVGCEDGSCLPWVKIARDPKRFRSAFQSAQKLGPIKGDTRFYKLVRDILTSEDQETFLVVLLDTQLHVRGISELARGMRDRVETPVNDVLRLAIVDGASTFLVAHNHPSGKSTPSKSDLELTKAIAKAGEIVGVPLMDHIVVGAKDFYSFAAHKQI